MIVTKHTQIVGLSAIILFVFSLALLVGMFYVISVAENDLILKQTEIANVRVHEQELNSLVRLVDESNLEREKLSSYLLQEEDVIDFLSLIESLAKDQGVSLDISGLNVTELNADFEQLSLAVDVKGSRDSVLRILTILETLPYQTLVSSVDIISSGESGTNGWSGKFILIVTKQKEV